ncbi:uncharacterized protein G2W53_021822 [Senna tora]|uniref:Uncharacterized protein n=1 Tax=Senna tora TaxID=362788 RepID=A0A834TK58_9FABA|nr:uncharacterized protein G2W53_021822 [Senna tora]
MQALLELERQTQYYSKFQRNKVINHGQVNCEPTKVKLNLKCVDHVALYFPLNLSTSMTRYRTSAVRTHSPRGPLYTD